MNKPNIVPRTQPVRFHNMLMGGPSGLDTLELRGSVVGSVFIKAVGVAGHLLTKMASGQEFAAQIHRDMKK